MVILVFDIWYGLNAMIPYFLNNNIRNANFTTLLQKIF